MLCATNKRNKRIEKLGKKRFFKDSKRFHDTTKESKKLFLLRINLYFKFTNFRIDTMFNCRLFIPNTSAICNINRRGLYCLVIIEKFRVVMKKILNERDPK